MVSSVKSKFKNIFRYTALSLVFSLIGLGLAGNGADAAGSATLNLTPTNGTYTVGDFVTFKITENSAAVDVNAVEADLNYDKNVMQFVSIDATQSAFTLAGPMVGGGGVVQIARVIDGSLPPSPSRTGVQTVASVTFKVIGSAASSTISFNTTSQIKSYPDHTDVWNRATAGATFVLKAAPVTPTPPTGGTSGGSGGSASSGGKTSTTKPSTSKPASTPVVATTAPVTTSSQPTETSGTESEPEVLTPTTSFVAVKVVDDKGKPVEGASVKLGGQTVKTDSLGIASFTNVTEGPHSVTVSYSGHTQTKSLDVKAADSNSAVQQFKVQLAAKKSVPTWLIYTLIAVVVLFILGFFIPRRKPKVGDFANANFAGGNVVVGGSGQVPAQPAPAPEPKPVPKPKQAVEPTPPGTIIVSDEANNNKEQKP